MVQDALHSHGIDLEMTLVLLEAAKSVVDGLSRGRKNQEQPSLSEIQGAQRSFSVAPLLL